MTENNRMLNPTTHVQIKQTRGSRLRKPLEWNTAWSRDIGKRAQPTALERNTTFDRQVQLYHKARMCRSP